LTSPRLVPLLPQAGEGRCQLIFHRQTKMYKLQGRDKPRPYIGLHARGSPSAMKPLWRVAPQPGGPDDKDLVSGQEGETPRQFHQFKHFIDVDIDAA